MTAQAILYTILMFSQHYYLMLAGCFAFGLNASVIWVVGYVFCFELMPNDSKSTVGSLISMIDGTTYLLLVIYFWKISKQWFWIILIGYIYNVLGAVLCWWLPESPAFLFSLNRYEEAAEVFAKIALVNKKENFKVTADEIRSRMNDYLDEFAVNQTAPSTMHFLRQPRVLANLCIMISVWLATSFDYYLILYLVNTFKQLYLCAIASSLSE